MSICTSRKVAASLLSSHSGATRPRPKSSSTSKFRTVLADRLHIYRNEIAPEVIGRRPDVIFLTRRARRGARLHCNAIQKADLRHLGVKMTPHQFRHLCAKIILDCNPGRLRTGAANAGTHQSENDDIVLCRHRHAAGRTSSCRSHHEAARIEARAWPPPSESWGEKD